MAERFSLMGFYLGQWREAMDTHTHMERSRTFLPHTNHIKHGRIWSETPRTGVPQESLYACVSVPAGAWLCVNMCVCVCICVWVLYLQKPISLCKLGSEHSRDRHVLTLWLLGCDDKYVSHLCSGRRSGRVLDAMLCVFGLLLKFRIWRHVVWDTVKLW